MIKWSKQTLKCTCVYCKITPAKFTIENGIVDIDLCKDCFKFKLASEIIVSIENET